MELIQEAFDKAMLEKVKADKGNKAAKVRYRKALMELIKEAKNERVKNIVTKKK